MGFFSNLFPPNFLYSLTLKFVVIFILVFYISKFSLYIRKQNSMLGGFLLLDKIYNIDEHHCQQFARGDLNSNMFQLQCSLSLQVLRKVRGH